MPSESIVLLVDDDRDVNEGTSTRLRAEGYQIVTARDGDECIRLAIEYHPVAIVLDVRMPIMDGLAALDELQAMECTKHIPVVMLSASLADQRSALEAGARFFLRKPYSAPMLIDAVKAAIEEADINRAGTATVNDDIPSETHIRRKPSSTDSSNY